MGEIQHVCMVCGYNLIGAEPQSCPFCGADCEHFITAQQCSDRYRVHSTPVCNGVSQLRSQPKLGLEHAAYRVETSGGVYWIDCPSCFDLRLAPADRILFTHHHFLGASNLYRSHFAAEVGIHRRDSGHELCRGFTFDCLFDHNFAELGIEAFHIGGHTPGFTMYLFGEVLFICDYVFWEDDHLRFNPFGPAAATVAGGRTIQALLKGRQPRWVCGYNAVVDYAQWKARFDRLVGEC